MRAATRRTRRKVMKPYSAGSLRWLLILTIIVAPPMVKPQSLTDSASQAASATSQLGVDEDAAFLSNALFFHHGEDPAVTRGRTAFFQRDLRKLGGNGRSCADCHMPFDGFQLSPAAAKARFDLLQ